MAYLTERQHHAVPVALVTKLTDLWTSWAHNWFEKQARKRDIRQLLSYDDRLLADMGASRTDLVGELGYDPREMPMAFDPLSVRMPEHNRLQL